MFFIKTHFTFATLRNKAFTQIIEHTPCCILAASAGAIGIPALSHNPVLELGFALGGAIAGEHIGHSLAKKFNWHHACGGPLASKRIFGIPKDYIVALSIGLATWGGHQALFHDHGDHHHQAVKEIHDHGPHGHDHAPH